MKQRSKLHDTAVDSSIVPWDRETAILELAKRYDAADVPLFEELAADSDVIVRWAARWVLFSKLRRDDWIDRIEATLVGPDRDSTDTEGTESESFDRIRAVELLAGRVVLDAEWGLRGRAIGTLCRVVRAESGGRVRDVAYAAILRAVGRYRRFESITSGVLANVDLSIVERTEQLAREIDERRHRDHRRRLVADARSPRRR